MSCIYSHILPYRAEVLHASGDGEYAPVDEHGIPKYKGKKRGRKPKPRKRQRKPGTPKRKHTAYTLFMKETYPIARQQRTGGVPSKVIITEVANMWKAISATEKATWKAKAQEVNQAEVDATARDLACEVDNFEEGEDDGTDYDGVDDVMGTKSGPSAV